jgi:membrane-associated phospholipid phosphatase
MIKKRLTFTLFFTYLFFGIIQDYIGQESLIQTDLNIINFISHFRTPSLNHFMLFITYLAQGQNIAIAVIFSLIILILLHKWSYISSLLISVLGGEIFVWIIKNIIDRPRPPLTNALITETSYSFPSGHTFIAIAFYGLITFFLFDSLKKKSLKVISLTLGIILVILIGTSRIYLGAHWPSDVLASYFSGLAWLTVIITITYIKKKFYPKINPTPYLQTKTIAVISVILIITYLFSVYLFYKNHPF